MGIVIDTETTGLTRPSMADIVFQPHITEIYLGKFDEETFEIVDEMDTFVKPVDYDGVQIPLEKHIIRITNIEDEMLINAPTFGEVASEIYEFIKEEELVVAHNAMFDLNVIKYGNIRFDMENLVHEFRRKCCTVEMSYPIKKKRMKNSELYYLATGEVIEGVHRAKPDALSTLRSFKWLVESGF